jgi:hypothetical protein
MKIFLTLRKSLLSAVAALFLLVVTLGLPSPALAAFAFVAAHQNSLVDSATTSVTFTVATGQSLLIFATDGGASGATLTVTDSLSNTFVSRKTINDTFDSESYALIDCITPATAGSDTITLTSSIGATGFPGIVVLVYTGIASYDQSTAKFAHTGWAITTNGATSTAIVPTSQPVTLLGFASGQGGTITGDAGSNIRANNTTPWPNGQALIVEDYELTSTASTTSNFTFSSATASSAIIAGTYIESAGGSSCTNQFWSSSGTWAVPNGTTGSYWSTTGAFLTPNCSTGSFWLKSGAIGAN